MCSCDEIDSRIENAAEGMSIWENLVKKYGINSQIGVYQVTNQQEYDMVYHSLKKIRKDKRYEKIIIICSSGISLKKDDVNEWINVVLDDNKLKCLIQFYCLIKFAPNYYLASIEYLNASKGLGFLNKENIQYEEIYRILALDLVE